MGVRLGLLATIVLVLTLGACGTIPENDPLRSSAAGGESAASTPTSPSTPVASGASPKPGAESCEYEPTGDAARSVRPPSPTGVATSGAIGYDLAMTEGTVRITLDPVRAPCTVHSFVSLAEQGFFDATKCHRLVDSGIFLFQCGDPTGTGRGGPGYTFAAELDGTEAYTKGVIAMANDGSQFFLVYRDSSALDKTPDYTIFGEIDPAGISILERMAAEGQDGTNSDGGGRPNNPSEILEVTPAGR
ncbi:MAG: peptidylprolyl isomerase [Propionibacteriaceae bacterium]